MTKTNLTSQNGRSMVEMLGVLAIIGVLSVGGIAGYSAAMRKYRANVLLNQASIAAADIAGQIASGSPNLDLSGYNASQDFGSISSVKGSNGLDNYQEGDDQFTLVMEDVDEEICALMQKQLGQRSTVRKVECYVDGDGKSIATLTFNKDLSNKPLASDFDGNEDECKKAGFKWCSGKGSSGACSNSSDCCEGYDSQCCNSETGNISSTESCTTKDGKTATCSNGKCEFGTENCQDKDCCDSIGAKWIEDVYGNTGVCFDSKKGEHATCWYAGCQKCTDYKTALIASDAPIGVCYDAKTEKAKCNNYDCEVCTSQQVKEGMDVFCDGYWGSCSCMKFLYDINNNPCFQNLDKNKICCSNVDNDGNCCYDNFDKNGKCCLYYYDETSNTCCETGNESDGCCSTMYSGIGLDSKGQCCQFYLDKNKKCCKDYDEVSNTCCETGNESDGCCSIRYGGSGLDSQGQCCQYYLDKNGECCYGYYYDEANEACCMGPSDSEYCSTVF